MLVLALLLQAGPDPALVASGLREEVAGDSLLVAHYAERGWRPSWFSDGRLTAAANRVRFVLAGAAERGLDPNHYSSSTWTVEEVAAAERNADWLAAFDVGLTRDALQFARDLAIGRIDPVTLMRAARIAPASRFDRAATLRAIQSASDPVAVFDAMQPDDRDYRALLAALPRLRVLAERMPPFPVTLLADVVHPGDTLATLGQLAAHLRALGDTGLDAAAGELYQGPIVEAVQRFQARHGLVADGIIGPATRAALATPLAWRVRQVELALERHRWFGSAGTGPRVEVDVAAAMLRHHDPARPGDDLESRVIVGNPDWPTPVLQSEIVRVILNPEWIVPASIARGELLPQFRADSTLFARDGYELRRNGTVVPPTPENLAAVGRGVVLRQRPGPRNALGRIKIEIAGTSAVHLHDTPGRHLFARDDRWLSHGCVRVHQVETLARRLLASDPAWSPERFAAALADSATTAITLRQPVPVRLRYATAAVGAEGGVVFRPDRYDRDRRLDEALRGKRQQARRRESENARTRTAMNARRVVPSRGFSRGAG